MSSDNLINLGKSLVKRFNTRDPFEIANGLGIIVKECPNFGSLKGMYTIIKRNRFIFINNELNDETKKIVCAHEIGHDQLHRNIIKHGIMKEFTLYDIKSKPEYEANILCSEILIDTDELVKNIYEYHYTAEEISKIMRTDINLIALKVTHLISIGYKLKNLDFKSNFLK